MHCLKPIALGQQGLSCSYWLQADLFEYLCLEAQQHRRDVELNALEPMVGSDPLTPPQLALLQQARQQHHQGAVAARRQADMLRQAQAGFGLTCQLTMHTASTVCLHVGVHWAFLQSKL